MDVGLVLTLGFLAGLAVGYATARWSALAITILVPLIVYPGSVIAWLLGAVPFPYLTAGVITAVVASTGCAAAVFIRQSAGSAPD